MREIVVKISDNNLVIEKKRARQTENDIENIELESLERGKLYISKVKITNQRNSNKIFLMQKINIKSTNDEKEEKVVIVYSKNGKIMYSYCTPEMAYKRILKVKYKVLKLSLNKKSINIILLAYIINKYNLNIQKQTFYIDQIIGKEVNFKQKDYKMNKLDMIKTNNIYKLKFDICDILQDTSEINGNVRITLVTDNTEVNYRIGIKSKKIKNKRHYYAPIKSIYIKDYALHFRRTNLGNLVLVKRKKEPIENSMKFKIMESTLISNCLYLFSKLIIPISRKKINLFYEKFSSKAEEGTYDLFLLAKKDSKYRNYFIIDQNSEDYNRIKNEKNVVKKYSLKYYFLLFNACNFISTEAPIHLNILRSNNIALRKSICDKKFIFLQHGVTYMKCQGTGSTFAKGKEGEAKYIIVGSEKEKDAIIDMLKINEENIMKTGLPIFSKINYEHINKDSEDIVTIMLTWKPYEEQLYSFNESSYYKNTIKIYNVLAKYINKNKIIVIPHPKVSELLKNTDLKENIWTGKISEILNKTKMLITDYSSVCYNSFYQGGGVVFYQEDLELYESKVGKLIPSNDEYIGKRVFSIQEFEEYVKLVITNGNIKLDKLRNSEYKKNYKTINEFADGKNIERIFLELKKLNII